MTKLLLILSVTLGLATTAQAGTLFLDPDKSYLCDGNLAMGWRENSPFEKVEVWDPRSKHIIEPHNQIVKTVNLYGDVSEVEITHVVKKVGFPLGGKSYCLKGGTGCATVVDGFVANHVYSYKVLETGEIKFVFNRLGNAATFKLYSTGPSEEIASEIGTCTEF